MGIDYTTSFYFTECVSILKKLFRDKSFLFSLLLTPTLVATFLSSAVYSSVF